jgi:hypothetical protein
LVNVAWYSLAFIVVVTELNVSVVEVAPDIVVNVTPALVETLHWTLGVGLPVTAALKLAFDPALTLAFEGLLVTSGALGAVVTLRVATAVVAVPLLLENTASYR